MQKGWYFRLLLMFTATAMGWVVLWPSLDAWLQPIGCSIAASIADSVVSGSLKPSPEKNLMPLSG